MNKKILLDLQQLYPDVVYQLQNISSKERISNWTIEAVLCIKTLPKGSNPDSDWSENQ